MPKVGCAAVQDDPRQRVAVDGVAVARGAARRRNRDHRLVQARREIDGLRVARSRVGESAEMQHEHLGPVDEHRLAPALPFLLAGLASEGAVRAKHVDLHEVLDHRWDAVTAAG